jgi:hypothetical protein
MKALLELEAKYIKKSEKLAEAAHGEGAAGKLKTSMFYIQMAANVRRLIEQ